MSIENQLKWAEEHFREPRINYLEGWGLTEEPMNSGQNEQWMRLFTTMSLIFFRWLRPLYNSRCA